MTCPRGACCLACAAPAPELVVPSLGRGSVCLAVPAGPRWPKVTAVRRFASWTGRVGSGTPVVNRAAGAATPGTDPRSGVRAGVRGSVPGLCTCPYHPRAIRGALARFPGEGVLLEIWCCSSESRAVVAVLSASPVVRLRLHNDGRCDGRRPGDLDYDCVRAGCQRVQQRDPAVPD